MRILISDYLRRTKVFNALFFLISIFVSIFLSTLIEDGISTNILTITFIVFIIFIGITDLVDKILLDDKKNNIINSLSMSKQTYFGSKYIYILMNTIVMYFYFIFILFKADINIILLSLGLLISIIGIYIYFIDKYNKLNNIIFVIFWIIIIIDSLIMDMLNTSIFIFFSNDLAYPMKKIINTTINYNLGILFLIIGLINYYISYRFMLKRYKMGESI